MGSSYREDNGPSMCYNSVKTWQLGWFQNYHVHILVNSLALGDELWSGKLYGSVDMSSADANNDAIIVKLDGTSMGNLYISFNRKRGFNEGTKKGGNKVLIHSKEGGEFDYAMSDLLAIMNGGDVYSVTIHGVTVTISVRDILIGSDGQKYADIQIASPDPSDDATDDSTSDCLNGNSYAASYITLGGEVISVVEESCISLESRPDSIRETICSRDIHFGDVLSARDACPKACGTCGSSSPSPSSEPHICTESPGDLFAHEYQIVSGKIVGVNKQACSWLMTLKRKKRRKICNNDISYVDIKSASEVCPYSCHICSLAPSSIPSSFPTLFPTSIPSRSSDGSNGGCEDDGDIFLFKAKKRKGNVIGAKKIQTCGWLKSQPQDKINKSCGSEDFYGEYLPSQDVSKSTCGIEC